MSKSKAKSHVQLTVNTGDDATEIYCIDSRFRLVARGLGTLHANLEPGIYKIKVRAGLATDEKDIVLRPDDPERTVSFSHLRFASPVPLPTTANSHEFHIDAAEKESRRTHVSAGHGSHIFVFARSWTGRNKPTSARKSYPHPAKGLVLRDQSGRVIADIAKESKKKLSWEPWAACNVEVDPGSYILSLETEAHGRIEQTIVATKGWQTQVFLLQRNVDEELPGVPDSEALVDMASGAILMAKGKGFSANNSNLRLTELARLGLTNKRKVLPDEVTDILWRKHEDPMLGIYGAHLLLLDKEPDLNRLRIVVTNLRELLGKHPDVEALALLLEDNEQPYMFEVPPMLRRSWWAIVEGTMTRPDLVPRGSLSARIAGQVWSEEPWLLWSVPTPSAIAQTLDSAPDEEVVALDGFMPPRAFTDAQMSDEARALGTSITSQRGVASLSGGDPTAEKAFEAYDYAQYETVLQEQLSLVQPAGGTRAQSDELESLYDLSGEGQESMVATNQLSYTDVHGVRSVVDEGAANWLVRVMGVPRSVVEQMLEQQIDK